MYGRDEICDTDYVSKLVLSVVDGWTSALTRIIMCLLILLNICSVTGNLYIYYIYITVLFAVVALASVVALLVVGIKKTLKHFNHFVCMTK